MNKLSRTICVLSALIAVMMLVPVFVKALNVSLSGNVSLSDNWEIPNDSISRAQLIIEYDKILTGYSLDYIASGNVFWKEQYDLYGERLDKLIKLAESEANTAELKDLFSRQDKANLVLVDMELRAHALVKEGKKAEAKALIESSEYVKWKRIYSETVNEYLNILGIPNAPAVRQESLTQLSVQLKALEVASEIDSYIAEHPHKTIAQLQNDSFFNSLAVQKVGNTGYTDIVDSESGVIYFHPQKNLINQDTHQFSESLPSFFAIIEKSLGATCKESSGLYDWKEADNSISQKYMYVACVKSATADGRHLFVAATTYINDSAASHYLNLYKVGEFSTFAQDSIKQKAIDVAKQIEIYIKSNPGMSVVQLQNNTYFQSIAVQQVGKTGYTAVADANTLINRFHQNPKIVNLDLSTLAAKLPGFWAIMSRTRGGLEAEGVYDWLEADGRITQKYMYIAVVNATTADGVRLNVAATTYLDEYAPITSAQTVLQNISNTNISSSNNRRDAGASLNSWIFSFAAFIIILLIVLFVLYKTKVIVLERNTIMYAVAFVLVMIIGLFLLNTYQVTSNLREQTMSSFKSEQLLLAKQTSNMLETYFDFILKDAEVTSGNRDLLGGSGARGLVVKREYNRLDLSQGSIHIALVSRNGSLIDEYPGLYAQHKMLADAKVLSSAGYYSYLEKVFVSGKTEMAGLLMTNSSRYAVLILLPVFGNDSTNGVNDVRYVLQVAVFMDKPFLDTFSLPLNLTGEAHVHLIIGNVSLAGVEIPGEEDFFKNPVHIDLMNKISAGMSGVSEHKHNILLNGTASTKQVVSAYTPVDVLDEHWAVTLETLSSKAYEPIASSIGRVWIFTATIILVTLIIGVFIVIFLTDSLRKEIHEKTRLINETNKNLEATVKQRTSDLEKLNKELESRVDERTKELNAKVKDLTDTRTAVLNILEDVNASKDEIETSRASLLILNKQMTKANAELKRMDTYKNEFISTTAHELKTPLASIHGFASLLQNRKAKENIKQRDYYLSIIMQDSDRLKKLIDDILDLSRLDLGTMKFIFDNVNVRESFKDIVKEMYLIATNKGLILKADVASQVPQTIVTDKSRLNQVLINLVNNAVKYTDTEKKKGKKITLLACRKKGNVLFSVTDQGVGIAKKDYGKLFKRFSQIDSSYTRKVGGTGLGLAISKGIVHALGGKIWMKSTLGKGTTFYFTIPIKNRLVSSAEADLSVLGSGQLGSPGNQGSKQQSDVSAVSAVPSVSAAPKNIALNGVKSSGNNPDKAAPQNKTKQN